MGIALDASTPVKFVIVNSPSGTAGGTSASFTPPANSVITAEICVNSGVGATPTFTAPTFSGTGVGAFTLVPGGSNTHPSGGASAIFQAIAGASPTAGTVSFAITTTGSGAGSGASESDAKIRVWTGCATSQTGAAVAAGAGGRSATQNFSPAITTTRAGSRVIGVGVDWNEKGVPTSTDTIDGYDVATMTSGGFAHKAADSGAPGSVALNFNAAAAAPQWTTVLLELLAPATSAPVLMGGICL